MPVFGELRDQPTDIPALRDLDETPDARPGIMT
jgi:hypothetical protein